MGKIIVSDNLSLDGIVQDPAGDEGFTHGGWVGLIKDRPEIGKLAPTTRWAPRPWCWVDGATNGSPRDGHPGVASWQTG